MQNTFRLLDVSLTDDRKHIIATVMNRTNAAAAAWVQVLFNTPDRADNPPLAHIQRVAPLTSASTQVDTPKHWQGPKAPKGPRPIVVVIGTDQALRNSSTHRVNVGAASSEEEEEEEE